MGLSLGTASDGIKNEMSETKRHSSPIPCRILSTDPRSPTTNIPRTPIEVLRTPNASLTQEEPVNSSLDPRSPTTEFYRTPIVLSNLHNKHLDNAKNLTPVKPTSNGITPRLLETNTKIVKHQDNKRNSFVGLLETNIDYVETDLDTVAPESPKPLTTIEDNVNELLQIKDQEELELSIDKCVEELDKKLSDLIYEDKVLDVTTTLSKAKLNSRTPLGERHVNQRPHARIVPVLKVNDKPTQLPKNMSKIPIFKEKKFKGQLIQCENTPPRATTNRSHWSTEDSLII